MLKRTISKSKTILKSKRKTSKPSIKPDKTIGILHSGTGGKHDAEITALKNSLKLAGYTEGKNLTIVPKGSPLWSHDDPTELSQNADKLALIQGINLIIAAGGSRSTYEIARATNLKINGVFTTFKDHDSPSTNMTGVCARTTELDVLRLRTLFNLVQPPAQSTFGVLVNDKRPGYDLAPLQTAAASLNLKLDAVPVFRAAGESDQDVITRIKNAFAKWGKNGMKLQAALVAADPIFNDHRKEVITAQNANSIATMHQWKEFKDEGGYAAYGTSLIEAYKQAGTIAGQVLDGTAPSDIPVWVLNPSLSINRATAGRLRLTSKA
jgi:ABC-type uncharacterized transport system substrate-binding protein